MLFMKFAFFKEFSNYILMLSMANETSRLLLIKYLYVVVKLAECNFPYLYSHLKSVRKCFTMVKKFKASKKMISRSKVTTQIQ